MIFFFQERIVNFSLVLSLTLDIWNNRTVY